MAYLELWGNEDFLPLVTLTSALNKRCSMAESSEPWNEFALSDEKANH